MTMTLQQQQARQLEPKTIPADIKLVEESEIDVENIPEGLEHKMLCQNAIRGVVA